MEDFSLTYNTDQDQESRKKGLFWTVCVHLLLLLVLMLPLIQIPEPDTDLYQGILVAFGTPDQGSDPNAPSSASAALATEQEPTVSSPVQLQSEEVPAPSPSESIVEPSQPLHEPQEPPQAKFVQVLETQDISPVQIPEAKNPDEAADISTSNVDVAQSKEVHIEVSDDSDDTNAKMEQLRQEEKAREDAALAEQQRKIEEAKRQEAERQEAKRKQAEAERLAAEKQAREAQELANKKKLFEDGFSQPGNNDSSGDHGDPEGTMDADFRMGQAQGSGEVGAGLSNRGVTHTPKIVDQSQKTGTVVVNVCVDEQGQVISANFTQRGSTTVDANLISIAEQGARKYRFTSSEIEEQCGTITIHFRLQ